MPNRPSRFPWIPDFGRRRLILALAVLGAAVAVLIATAAPRHRQATDPGRANAELVTIRPQAGGPSFLLCDFVTFGPDQELGETYAYALMESIFRGAFRDRIRSMHRMPSNLYLPLKARRQDEGAYFRKLQEVGARTEATHVLEGSIDQESGAFLIHVYSCLSRQLIFMQELTLRFPYDPACNTALLAGVADAVVRSALEEIRSLLDATPS
jgi:hypothetical protein